MKSTCSSRSSRASQSPYTVEKQPKSTPDMYNPTHPIMGRGAHVYIPTWTFIAVVTTVYECCEDSDESRSTFFISLDNSNDYHNKRLLCHRFFTLSVPAACIYIRKLDVYIQFIFNCIVARSNNIGTVSFGSLDGLAIMGIKPFCS